MRNGKVGCCINLNIGVHFYTMGCRMKWQYKSPHLIKANIPFLARVHPRDAPQRQKLLCYQTDSGSGQDHRKNHFKPGKIHFILLMELRNNFKLVHLTSKTSVTFISNQIKGWGSYGNNFQEFQKRYVQEANQRIKP